MHTPRAYSEPMQAASDVPRRHRLTVDDYYRMAEVGILGKETRVELIDGEIIDMPPPGSPHAATVHYLARALIRAVEDRAVVLIQNPVRLNRYSEPQPDLALLKPRDDFYRAQHPRAEDVLLIVEVAATSLHYDRRRKLPLYATHGILEAWLVDVSANRFVRHRSPQDGAYTLVDEPDPGAPLDVGALPGVAVDLGRLFG